MKKIVIWNGKTSRMSKEVTAAQAHRYRAVNRKIPGRFTVVDALPSWCTGNCPCKMPCTAYLAAVGEDGTNVPTETDKCPSIATSSEA